MMKNYLFIFLVCSVMCFSHLSDAQSLNSAITSSNTIEGLSIFPNPVNDGKLLITSKQNLPKTIEVYDVLGKQIFTTSIIGKTLNVSKLSPGIYILKIKENNITATRKLIVR